MIDNQSVVAAAGAIATMVTVLIGILLNHARLSDLNQRLGELRSHVDGRFNDVDRRFNDVNRRFGEFDDRMDQRFEDVKAMWRSELRRVEEVIDARLKHLEER